MVSMSRYQGDVEARHYKLTDQMFVEIRSHKWLKQMREKRWKKKTKNKGLLGISWLEDAI